MYLIKCPKCGSGDVEIPNSIISFMYSFKPIICKEHGRLGCKAQQINKNDVVFCWGSQAHHQPTVMKYLWISTVGTISAA